MRAAAVVAIALFGCGTSGSPGASGVSAGSVSAGSGSATEADASPQPQAFVQLAMSPSLASPGMCVGYPTNAPLMQVGQPGVPTDNPPIQPTRVSTGTQSVTIACSVHQEGDSFAINLRIAQGNVSSTGATTLTITGMVNASTGGTNLTGDVSNTIAGNYSSSACTVSFGTPGAGASPQGPSVAAGRIWAHLSCPAVQSSAVTTQSGAPSTCDAEADFVFENCAL
jgi:hypothetical protein